MDFEKSFFFYLVLIFYIFSLKNEKVSFSTLSSTFAQNAFRQTSGWTLATQTIYLFIFNYAFICLICSSSTHIY